METNIALVAILALVWWFGSRILDRLPKSQHHPAFTFDSSKYFAIFRIDAVTEKDFDIAFVGDWNVGRPFMLYGPLRVDEDNNDERRGLLEARERVGVHIYPIAQWFERSQIGYIRTYENGGWECHVSLPYQIARHVLEDVRRDPDQVVMIGFDRTTGKDGKWKYPIYSFELSEAFV